MLPVFLIVRAADRKTAHEINQELQASRETPLGSTGAMSALEMVFFPASGGAAKALVVVCPAQPILVQRYGRHRRCHIDGHVYVRGCRRDSDHTYDDDAVDWLDREKTCFAERTSRRTRFHSFEHQCGSRHR